MATVFGGEDSSPTNWAKPEYEPVASVANMNVFSSGAEGFAAALQ
jgi:hypothetical protein